MAWSETAILKNRRRKLARRTWKKIPLFAYEQMRAQYPDYLLEEFLADLKPKTPPKKRKGKSPLVKYGRYPELQRLLSIWDSSTEKDAAIGLQVLRLRENIRTPFKLLAVWNREKWCFEYPPTYSISTMNQLTALANECKTKEEYEQRAGVITATMGMGN